MNPYTRIKDLEERVDALEDLGHDLLHTVEDLLVQFDEVLVSATEVMKTLAPKKKKRGRPSKK